MRLSNAIRNASPKRYLTMMFGTGMVLLVWFTTQGGSRASQRLPEDETGLVVATEANQEDFVTNAKSSINTVPLPVAPVDWVKPVADATKPTLWLHVGPLKTGVKALAETELSNFSKELKADKYTLFPGSLEGLHEPCQKELYRKRQELSQKAKFDKPDEGKSLAEQLAAVPCWKAALDDLAPFAASKTSVIVADETLGTQFLTNVPDLGPAVFDWIALHETLFTEWNVQVVLSYRRYYEWLPSAKAATEQRHLQKHGPSPPRLALWPGNTEHGMLLEPLFPHFLDNALEKLDIPYTTRLQDLYQPFVTDVSILNLYVPDQSVATTFLCDVLTTATTACDASQAKDVQRKVVGSLSLDTRTALLDVPADAKWFDFQLYDEMAVSAAGANMIRIKFASRTTATTTTQFYVESYLKLQARKELPMVCPKEQELNVFLEQSLQFERFILPNYMKTHAAVAEKEHRLLYNQLKTSHQFCHVNMDPLLRQVEWRTFFRHLTEAGAIRIQKGGKPGPDPIHLTGGTRGMRRLMLLETLAIKRSGRDDSIL